VLAKKIFAEVKSPEGQEMRGEMDDLRRQVGAEAFRKLMAEIEQHADQVVGQMSHKDIEES